MTTCPRCGAPRPASNTTGGTACFKCGLREAAASAGPRYSLRLVNGPLDRGLPAAYPLEGRGQLVIGRSDRSDVVVRVGSVSRRHATVWNDNGLFHIMDLGSRAGTFVNGAAIKAPQALYPGDRINLGEAIAFELCEVIPDYGDDEIPCLPEDDTRDDPPYVELGKDLARAGSSAKPAPLPASPVPRLSPEALPVPATPSATQDGLPVAELAASKLAAAAELCRAAAAAFSVEALAFALVDILARAISCDRVLAYLVDPGDRLQLMAQKLVSPDAADLPAPSRGILRRVQFSLSSTPFATCDAQNERGFSARASIMLSNVRAVLCVSILAEKTSHGVIYADCRDMALGFHKDDELLMEVASHVFGSRLSALLDVDGYSAGDESTNIGSE